MPKDATLCDHVSNPAKIRRKETIVSYHTFCSRHCLALVGQYCLTSFTTPTLLVVSSAAWRVHLLKLHLSLSIADRNFSKSQATDV